MVVNVLESYGHDLRLSLNGHMPEKLQPLTWWKAGCNALSRWWSFLKYDFRSKRPIQNGWSQRSSVNWARYEFPERLEILKCRSVGIEIVCGGIVHVGRDPQCVADIGALNEGEYVGDLEFAPPWCTIVAVRYRLKAPPTGSIIDDD